MSASFTPGPWVLDPPDAAHVISDDYHQIKGADGVSEGRWTGFTLSGFMSLADARLIAAAPDLFDVAKRLIEWVETRTCARDVNSYDIGRLLDEARAAIAAAEGEQP